MEKERSSPHKVTQVRLKWKRAQRGRRCYGWLLNESSRNSATATAPGLMVVQLREGDVARRQIGHEAERRSAFRSLI